MLHEERHLSAEQRRALKTRRRGAGRRTTVRLAHGFNVYMLADMVRDGLATAHRETVRVGKRKIKVARLDHGRWPKGDRRLELRPLSSSYGSNVLEIRDNPVRSQFTTGRSALDHS
jgi:hypothetical protein